MIVEEDFLMVPHSDFPRISKGSWIVWDKPDGKRSRGAAVMFHFYGKDGQGGYWKLHNARGDFVMRWEGVRHVWLLKPIYYDDIINRLDILHELVYFLALRVHTYENHDDFLAEFTEKMELLKEHGMEARQDYFQRMERYQKKRAEWKLNKREDT